MFSILQLTAVFWLICLLSGCSPAYELQDTIHTLEEENLHLQQRLENLTGALRDLKHLLMEHSKTFEENHDPEYQHIWREWSQHGISSETHQMLEQVFCLSELHDAADFIFITQSCLLLSTLVSMILVLLS